MELLSSINNSGIGAQYAVSAAKDVNGNEITSTYLTAVPEGYATESFVTSQGYITGSYLTADALDNVSSTWNTVTNKLDSTAFSTVSGSFLTAHQALPNSANWNATYNTVNGNSATWNSTYDTVHDNSASWTGGTEYSAGSGIDITDDVISLTNPLTLVPSGDVTIDVTGTSAIISVTGGAAYTGDAQGALDEVYSKSGDWNTVTDKLNTTAFSTVSGNFLTAHQTLSDSANWNATYTAVSNNSATWATVTDKLNSTAFSTVSGDFLTAHQALPNSANWDSTYTTVYDNSASWTGGGGGVVTSTAGTDGYVTAINGSGLSGASASVNFDVYGISAGEGITLSESASALWINATGGGESRTRLYYDPSGIATAAAQPNFPGYYTACYQMSESPMNFERLEIYTGPQRLTMPEDGKNIGNGFNSVLTETITGGRVPASAMGSINVTSTFVASVTGSSPKYYISNGTLYGCSGLYWWWRETPKNWQCGATAVVTDNAFLRIYEVVGVNRTASN